MARSSEATEANFGFDVDEADRFTLGGILKTDETRSYGTWW